jgi:hypothetical protein
VAPGLPSDRVWLLLVSCSDVQRDTTGNSGGQLATVHEQQQTARLFVITPTLYPLKTGPVKRVTSDAASFAWAAAQREVGLGHLA